MGFKQDILDFINFKESIPESKVDELQNLVDRAWALEWKIIKITDIEDDEHPIKKFDELMLECKKRYKNIPSYLIDEGEEFMSRYGENLKFYDKHFLEELHNRSSK